jgi:HEAT repeat protein
LIRRESQVTSDEGKRQYGVALRRLLSEQSLRRYVPYLLDELYASDVIALIRRAGKDGTKVLIDMVVRAETFAERKTYMSVLRQVEEGTEVIAGMLAHREWFVVRNMADLAGELRIEEAVLPLGRAVEHEDARVRRSVGIALAKIGTPATVPFLAKILQDADPSVRSAVFKEVGGRGHSALAMPLVNALDAEPDAGVRGEYYRALGRIGTQDAIEALRKVAEGGGRLFGRRPASDRIAAVEGLALANTTTSQSVLRSLKDDRTKEIREIARRADQPPAP